MSTHDSTTRSAFHRRIDIVLVVLGLVSVVFIVFLLSLSLVAQYHNYKAGIDKVILGAEINYGALLTFSRAWDFALIKTSGLFLGFLLIFVGMLYVLRTAEATFTASVEPTGLGKGSLSSSSPGLVLSALGVLLVLVVVFNKSSVTYSPVQDAPQTPGVDGVPVEAIDLDARASHRSGPQP